MAGYECLLCGGEHGDAVTIITSLVNGQTVALCSDDQVTGMIGGLATQLGVDGEKLYDAIRRFVDREAAKEAKARAAAGPHEAPVIDECPTCGEMVDTGNHKCPQAAAQLAEATS